MPTALLYLKRNKIRLESMNIRSFCCKRYIFIEVVLSIEKTLVSPNIE